MSEVPFARAVVSSRSCVMALHEHDRVLRKTGAFRDNKNMAILGVVLSALMLIAFVLLGAPR
jgi:hypothetical protein